MIKNLIVQINSDCNLKCKYCYSRNDFNINKLAIKKSVENAIKKYKGIENVIITGGEPLLEYRFIIGILGKFKGKKISKSILTNGLLLNNQRVRELRNLNANVRISIDSFVTKEKKPTPRLIELISKNRGYLKYASKVITKKNLNYIHEDILQLIKLGFNDIDIIPQMYRNWNSKEIATLAKGFGKAIPFCQKKGVVINSPVTNNRHNRYYKCNSIRVLPDGDISLCNSLNSTKKNYFLTNRRLDEFEKFRNKRVRFALKEYRKKKWFKEHYLNGFCMVDAFYHSYLNNKSDKWIASSIELFSKLGDVVKKCGISQRNNKRYK